MEKESLRGHQPAVENKSSNCKPVAVVAIISYLLLLILAIFLLAVMILMFNGTIDFHHQKMGYTTVTEHYFGTSESGENVKRYEMSNTVSGMQVEVISLGAALKVLKVPDRNGDLLDVILGYDTLQQYEGPDNPYFGVVIGRYTSRIANAKFTYMGIEYNLPVNNGQASHHGGPNGWSMKVWDSYIDENTVVMTLMSPDGDEGYPGEINAEVRYQLTDDGELSVVMNATASKTSPINMALHPYFNLEGEGSTTMYDNMLSVYADRYVPVDDSLIPTGEYSTVDNTLFDLRLPTRIGDRVNLIPGGGYDHSFCVNGPTGKKLAARLSHNITGIVMDLYTNQPGMQVYAAHFVDVPKGKNEHSYGKYSGIALEAQNHANAPNQRNFPDPFLPPGSEYIHTVSYKFSSL